MNEYSDSETEKRIYDLIAKNPGLYRSKIAEMLKMPISSVDYHLLNMQREKIILILKEDGYERYYLEKRKIGIQDKRMGNIRDAIYNLILENPGLHLSKIAEKLKMSAQLAEYHLAYLERKNHIAGIKEPGGYYRRYYVKDGDVGVKDKKIVALLRQEHLLRIVLIILKKPNIKHKDLLSYLDITPGTLSHHLNRLDEGEIIEVFTYGRDKGYKIRNKKEIVWIIRKYIMDLITDSFNDLWSNMNVR